MTKQKLTQEQIDNIKNYNGEIETIEDLMEVIRLRPGMYIGPIGDRGFLNMIREIFQNSLDELIKADSPCDTIWVSFDERDNTVIVRDNGRGIPYDNIIRIYTVANTSSNYHKREGEFSAGMHGIGSKATAALSSDFIVESYILGEGRRVELHCGYPWKAGEKKIPNKEKYQGTVVEFRPDYDILGVFTISWKAVYHLIASLVPLSKIGAVVHFMAIDSKGKEYKETIVNEDGIITDLIKKTTSPIVKPIMISQANGFMTMDVAFTYDSDDLAAEEITAFANMCPTVQGTHINGMMNSICKFFMDYMNKIYLAGNKRLSVIRNDIKPGLKGIISVFHLNPNFTGQAKEILSNEDMEKFVYDCMMIGLEQWSKLNPNDLQKLCKYFKDIAEIRMKSDKEKVKLSNNYRSSAITGLPSKYKKANSKHKCELIIIEGDSAGGQADICRNKDIQAVFPIRGKLPNAFDTPRAKFLANDEIAGLLTIFDNGGYGKTFDIDLFESKWDKIILAPDKDADGDHILSLGLYFVALYCPQIITHGHLYGAVPPLFGYRDKKGKMIYFNDKIDYIKFIQNMFAQTNVVLDYKTKKKYPDREITGLIYRNRDYVEEINRVATTFSIDPYVLEQIIIYHNLSYDKFKAKMEKMYRFLKVSKSNNVIVLEGLVGNKYQTIVLNDKMNSYMSALYKMSADAMDYYILNNQTVTLYTLMTAFDNSAPAGITRYKGLGEMNASELGASTLLPGSGRSLIRFNMEDVKKSVNEMRELNSNKRLILNSIGKVTKDDII